MTATEIQPQTVRAHEVFGDFWFNSEPVIVSALRGRVILVAFWDYTCVSCDHVLPYVQEWSKKYAEYGFVAVGVHTPKFPFARNPELVQKAIERLGISYPVVMDNEGGVAAKYEARTWPSLHLVDRYGYVRYKNAGEGNYQATERVLQTLLYDAGVDEDLPLLMEPLRAEDRVGSVLYRPTPELFAGYLKGSIGNVEGFSPESVVEYSDPDYYIGDRIYAVGSWLNERNSLRHHAPEMGRIILNYHALEVHAVVKPEGDLGFEVTVTQDNAYLTPDNKGDDVVILDNGKSVVVVLEPKQYSLVKNARYGEHVLCLTTDSNSFSLFSFMFVSSAIPELISNN